MSCPAVWMTLPGVKRRRSHCCLLLCLLTGLLSLLVITSSVTIRSDKKINITTQLLPICVGNLLDRREFNLNSHSSSCCDNNDDDIISRLMTSFRNPDGEFCRLMSYTSGRPIVACCLDALFHRHHHEWLLAKNDKATAETELIFIFIGDSRIRQQFINFVKVRYAV
jgi:hypothetical protein